MTEADCDSKFMPASEKETLEKQALTFSLDEIDVIIFHHFILDTKKPKLLSVLLKSLV